MVFLLDFSESCVHFFQILKRFYNFTSFYYISGPINKKLIATISAKKNLLCATDAITIEMIDLSTR